MGHQYLLVCTNVKQKGKCCGQICTDAVYQYIKKELNQLKLNNQVTRPIKAVKTSCLGKCAYGPNIIIYPDDVWYSYQTLEDINEILLSHILEGQIVTRLLVENISCRQRC